MGPLLRNSPKGLSLDIRIDKKTAVNDKPVCFSGYIQYVYGEINLL